MKKIVLFVITLCFMSCSNTDSNLEDSILTGNFKEISPIENRVTVDVTIQNLTYLRSATNSGTSFSIKLLSRNRLELSCNECDETAPQIVPYKIIDINTFEIGSFFLSPETEIITFERI